MASLVAVLAIGGCSEVTTGQGFPNDQDVLLSQSTDYAKFVALLEKTAPKWGDSEGTAYTHVVWNKDKAKGAPGTLDPNTQLSLDKETNLVVLGDPVSVQTRESTARLGATVDTYHPAGSSRDYVLLGSAYQSLAPTRWVSMPTVYPTSGYVACVLPGFQTFCSIATTMDYAEKNNSKGLPKRAVHNSDGSVTLISGVTLADMLLSRNTVSFPPVLAAVGSDGKITGGVAQDGMLDKYLTVRIKIEEETGKLLSVELNGHIKGTKHTLDIQVGYVWTGTAKAEHFLGAPSLLDITTLTSKKQVDDFYDRLAKIRPKG